MYKLKKENISGISPIILENAEEDNITLNIKGNSYQATREGYNLARYNTKVNKNIVNFDIGDIKKQQDYTLYLYIPIGTIGFNLKNKNDATTILTDWNKTGKVIKTFTASQDDILYFNGFGSSTDYNGITEIMLLKGTYTLDNLPTFEEYGIMPSLDYPSEVEAVGDNINIFDKDTAIIDKRVGAQGELFSEANYFASEFIEVVPNGIYTVNYTVEIMRRIGFYDKEKNFISGNIEYSTFNIPENCKYIRIGGPKELLDTAKLELGEKSTSYSPSNQGSVEIVHNNKNFLNLPDLTYTQNGVTIEVTNGNHFKITGTQTGVINKILYDSTYFKDINNIAYNKYPVTISRNTDENLPFELNFASDKSNWYMQISKSVKKATKTILNESLSRLVFYTGYEEGREFNYEFDLQLEISDQATEITTPYNKVYNLPIQKPFYSDGTLGLEDTFVYQNMQWYEEHNFRRINLEDYNWAEEIVDSSTQNYTKAWYLREELSVDNVGINDSAMCNYMKNLGENFNSSDEVGFQVYNGVKVRLPITIANTREEVKTYFTKLKEEGKGCYIIYHTLYYPELIECTQEQIDILTKIKALNGTNIISANSNHDFKIDCSVNYTPIMSNEVKQAFTTNVTKAYIIKTSDGMKIDQENYLKDLKLEELRFIPDNGFLGGTVARRLTINFNNVDNQFNIQDENIQLFIGTEYEGKDYYIDYGNFIVQKPETENTTDNTSFEALDYMCLLNAPYLDEIEYPCTLLDLAKNICKQAGLELGNDNFRNSDFIVTDNQFVNGESLRTILGAIALSAFSWARIGQDNKVYIDFNIKDKEDITLDSDKYYNLTIQSKIYGPINRIILRNSQIEGENVTIEDNDSINENGIHELVIADNPFAYTQEKREQLIKAGEVFFGFSYMPITSMDSIGYLYLDSNSLAKIIDMQGNEIYSYILNHTINYDGTSLDSIECPALTETETKYIYTPEESQKLKRTEAIVNKHEQTINFIIEEQTELGNKQNIFEQTLDSTTNTIKEVNNDLTERINELQINLDGLTQNLTQSGGNNIFAYSKEFWTGATDEDQPNLEEYTDTEIQQNSVSGVAYNIKEGTSIQKVQVKNNIYTISFTYKKLIELASGYVLINNTRYDLDSMDWKEIVTTINVETNYVDFEIISDTDNAFKIFDLMGAVGNTKQIWTQNANETRTDTVKIGKGITVSSSLTNTIWKADSDGNRIINTDTNEVVAEFTDKGTKTKNIEVENTAEIAGILIQKIDGQTWISSLL